MKPTFLPIFILLLFTACTNTPDNDTAIEESVAQDMEYDVNTSFRLMTLNNFTYDSTVQSSTDYAKVKETLELEIKRNKYTKDYELIWLGITSKNQNLTYVVRMNSSEVNTLAIVSRGTIASFVNIVEEDAAVYKLVNWSDKVSDDIKISKGANLALEKTIKLTSKIFGSEDESEVTLKEVLAAEVAKHEKTLLYITGHSLGGAITTALSLKFSENFYNDLKKGQLVIDAYNFAGQTVGNDFFRTYYDGYLSDSLISFSHNRVVNKYDLVPYAFDNLEGIQNIGFPFSSLGLIELEGLVKLIDASFSLKHKKYTHVGNPAIHLDGTLPPPNCDTEVHNLIVLGCWAAYQHEPYHYVDLLRAAAK